MEEVLSVVSRVAASEASVLIQGDSGTGKELIAKALHAASHRKNKPFIAFNVASFSESLIESELFGHEKGAFTGADKQKIGRFEQADGGTLFIDEIGDIAPSSQVKLLRVLQEGVIERVGGIKSIPVDVRIITATHQDLTEMIIKREFRDDLYYRINVVNIALPSLKDRKEDIPILVDHFTTKYAKKNHKDVQTLSRDALASLMRYDFPGNIRELENIIERAILLCRTSTIEDVDIALPEYVERDKHILQNSESNIQAAVENLEKNMILSALSAAKGNQSEAARQLGVSEKTLRYKLQKYNLK
jgi:DNA-binding NtrC family response regulator